MHFSRGEEKFESFDRSYEQYDEHFGTPGKNTNFWFGLRRMRTLIGASGKYDMAIQVCCGNQPGMTTYVQHIKVKLYCLPKKAA